MSIILLLSAQALGQEITTYYPLPSKAEQERELRQAQGLPPLPEPVKPQAVTQAQPPVKQAEADPPKPPPEPIEVQSVTTVRPDASVKFVPPPDEQPPH